MDCARVFLRPRAAGHGSRPMSQGLLALHGASSLCRTAPKNQTHRRLCGAAWRRWLAACLRVEVRPSSSEPPVEEQPALVRNRGHRYGTRAEHAQKSWAFPLSSTNMGSGQCPSPLPGHFHVSWTPDAKNIQKRT